MDWLNYLNIAAIVLASLVTVATVVAPMTKTKLDDKAVGILGALKKVVLALAVSLKK
jgi:hypothetical protein